jgi:hypothetical protein
MDSGLWGGGTALRGVFRVCREHISDRCEWSETSADEGEA